MAKRAPEQLPRGIEPYTRADGTTSYLVRWRDAKGKPRKKRGFATVAEAEKFQVGTKVDVWRGTYVETKRARRSFDEYADEWLDARADLEPGSIGGYTSKLKCHARPRFGDTPIGAIEATDVRALFGELRRKGYARSTLNQLRVAMTGVFDLAIEDHAIRENPVSGVKLAKAEEADKVFLTDEQVMDLAYEIEHPPVRKRGGEHRRPTYPEYGLAIRFDAYTGLRASELWGLKVERLNFVAGTVRVGPTVLTETRGTLHEGAPKTRGSKRTLPIPPQLLAELREHVAGKAPSDYVFTSPAGKRMRHTNWLERHFAAAAKRAQLPEGTTFHSLRHTCAAFLIAERKGPYEVMEWMGHTQITTTYGTYGHLFPGAHDDAAAALDARATKAAEGAAERARARASKVTDLAGERQRRRTG